MKDGKEENGREWKGREGKLVKGGKKMRGQERENGIQRGNPHNFSHFLSLITSSLYEGPLGMNGIVGKGQGSNQHAASNV